MRRDIWPNMIYFGIFLHYLSTLRLILWTLFTNWCYSLESKCWKAEFCKIPAIVGDFLFKALKLEPTFLLL